jgi:cell division protein FtsQ
VSPPTATETRQRRNAAAPTVDPRFEARRAAVAREQRRRRHLRLAAVAAVLGLAMGSFGITRSSLTDIDSITVTGWSRGEREEIIAASGLVRGAQLTDVDVGLAARRIEAEVPWVAAARVSRNWPSSVRITVVERRAVAQVKSDTGDWVLVDAGGRLLETQTFREAGLEVIEGVAPGAEPGAVLADGAARGVAVLAQMSPALLSRVSGLRLRGDDVELLLLPSGTVAFGPAEQVRMKLLALETVIARVDQSCVDAIDVRVPRRPLVSRDAACEADAGR